MAHFLIYLEALPHIWLLSGGQYQAYWPMPAGFIFNLTKHWSMVFHVKIGVFCLFFKSIFWFVKIIAKTKQKKFRKIIGETFFPVQKHECSLSNTVIIPITSIPLIIIRYVLLLILCAAYSYIILQVFQHWQHLPSFFIFCLL